MKDDYDMKKIIESMYVAQASQVQSIKELSSRITSAERAHDDFHTKLNIQIDGMEEKQKIMYNIFIEGSFVFKAIKWVGLTTTAGLVLWQLIKEVFHR